MDLSKIVLLIMIISTLIMFLIVIKLIYYTGWV
jgi:hypothetical protein